jgi:RNA 2',3'-cyclic 3'-phosphodiesterase
MRLFVAIDINNITIEQFQNYLIKKFNFNSLYVKPIKKDNLHITIKFLGEKTDLETKDIVSDLAKIHFTSFNMVFNNIGIFPHMKSPRIIWLGLTDESSKKLNDIYFQINGVLKKYDYEKNKSTLLDSDTQKFLPHLTIFRIRNNYLIPNFISSFSDGIILEGEEVNTISLKKSVLTSRGSIYSNLFNIYANKRNA